MSESGERPSREELMKDLMKRGQDFYNRASPEVKEVLNDFASGYDIDEIWFDELSE